MDEAIHHAAAAGDLDRAADLIAGCWAGYERSGWTATTQRWLALLPEDRVRADPRLCLAAALIAINLGRPEARPVAGRGGAGGGPPGAPGDPQSVASDVASGRSLVALLAGDAPGRGHRPRGPGAQRGRRAVVARRSPAWRSASPSTPFDERDAAYPYLEEASRCRPAPRPRAVVALSHLAHTDLDRDDLGAGRAAGAGGHRAGVKERHAEYPHAAGAHAGLAQARSRQGDHAAAREYADRGVDLARRGPLRPGDGARAAGAGRGGARRGRPRPGAGATPTRPGRCWTAPSATTTCTACWPWSRSSSAARRGAAAPAAGGDLTDRELAVLRRLTGDGSAREIAADLYVSHNTVKTQMRAIYRKLGVATREDAVARARERGLLPRPLSR